MVLGGDKNRGTSNAEVTYEDQAGLEAGLAALFRGG